MNIEAGGPGGLGSAGGGGGVGSAPVIISKTSGSFTTTGSVVAFTAPVAGVFQLTGFPPLIQHRILQKQEIFILFISHTRIYGGMLSMIKLWRF